LPKAGQTLWLQALKTAKAKLPAASTLFEGHCAAGSAEIIGERESYIATVRQLVGTLIKAEAQVSDAGKAALIDKISGLYPNWPLAMIIGMNIDGVAAHVWRRCDRRTGVQKLRVFNEQEFFAAFFQKRRPSFLRAASS
jgi:hypothetical protein